MLDNISIGSRNTSMGGISRFFTRSVETVDTVASIAHTVNEIREGLSYKGTEPTEFVGNLVARSEDLIAFATLVHGAKSWPQLLAATKLWLTSIRPGPLSINVIKYIESWSKIEPQSLGFTFSDVVDRWDLVKNAPIARHLANLFDVGLTFGIVPEQCPNIFNLSHYRSFQGRIWNVQQNAVSFLDMMLRSIKFFCEHGYHALKTGDWSGLLYEDAKMANMDREFALLKAAEMLVESGRLHDVIVDDGVKQITDLNEYESRVRALKKSIHELYQVETGNVRPMLAAKLKAVESILITIMLAKKNKPLRVAPFGLAFTGESSVAKSHLASLSAKIIPAACGFPSGKDSMCILNDADKFHSDYRSDHTTVIFDDHGNTRAEHYSEAPTNRIIQFINNVPTSALKAEAENKGNCMINAKLVVLTSNVENLLAPVFSNCPGSILRRFKYHIKVELKPEYVDPVNGGPLASKMQESYMPDAWNLKVRRAKLHRDNNSKCTLEDIHTGFWSVSQLFKFLVSEAKEHFASQTQFVNSVDDLFSMSVCPNGQIYEGPNCACNFCRTERADTLHKVYKDMVESVPDDLFDDVAANAGVGCYRAIMETEPHSGDLDSEMVDLVGVPRDALSAYTLSDSVVGALPRAQDVFFDAMDDNGDDAPTLTDIMYSKLKWQMGLYASLGLTVTLLTVAITMLRVNTLGTPHSGNVSDDTIGAREPVVAGTVPHNTWKKVVPLRVPCSEASKTTSTESLTDVVKKVLGNVTVEYHGIKKPQRCGIFPLCSNIWLLPAHMIRGLPTKRFCVRTTLKDIVGKNFDSDYDESCVYYVPNTDLAAVRLRQGGDNRDLTKFFLNDKMEGFSKAHSCVVFKDHEGQVRMDHAKYYQYGYEHVRGIQEPYACYSYTQNENTERGYCMATHVLDARHTGIVGFHLGGTCTADGRNTNRGICGVLFSNQVEDIVQHFESIGFYPHSAEGNMFATVPGYEYSVKPVVTTNSCQYLEDTDEGPVNLEVYGDSSTGKVTFHTGVRKSVISDSVAEIMSLPRMHGPPPKFQIWRHWSNTLKRRTVSRTGFDRCVMAMAQKDYTDHLLTVIDSTKWKDKIHVLDDDTILAGRDGIIGYDRVDLNTSAGFPWNKAKSHFVVESQRVVEGITAPLELVPEMRAEVDRCEFELAAGRRMYAVHRASLKDEPVKLGKDKIRVISGCPFPLTFLARKYFLSIVRMFQEHWLSCESAVGINAFGDQWHELATEFFEHGGNCFDGDFSSFDDNQSADDTIGAWEVLLDVARHCGYSEQALRVCRGIVTEIVYPMFEFDGTFMEVFGGLTSGHPLTTFANCIANARYFRYAWYTIRKRRGMVDVPYRDCVKSMFYGDDNFHSVHKDHTYFNRCTIAAVLAEGGVLLTPADKKGEMKEYTPFSDLSFLKRAFRYDAEIGKYMAPLALESLSKSLHNYRAVKGSLLTPQQRAGEAITNAAREFFQHGRAVYNERVQQLMAIADECSVTPYVTILDFDTLLQSRLNLVLDDSTGYDKLIRTHESTQVLSSTYLEEWEPHSDEVDGNLHDQIERALLLEVEEVDGSSVGTFDTGPSVELIAGSWEPHADEARYDEDDDSLLSLDTIDYEFVRAREAPWYMNPIADLRDLQTDFVAARGRGIYYMSVCIDNPVETFVVHLEYIMHYRRLPDVLHRGLYYRRPLMLWFDPEDYNSTLVRGSRTVYLCSPEPHRVAPQGCVAMKPWSCIMHEPVGGVSLPLTIFMANVVEMLAFWNRGPGYHVAVTVV